MKSNSLAGGEIYSGSLSVWHRLGPRKSEFALAVIFFAFTLAISFTGWAYYKRQEAVFVTAAQIELTAVADLKVSQIARWKDERMADANLILDDGLLRSAAQAFLDTPTKQQAHAQLRDWMSAYRHHSDCSRILLLDTLLRPRLGVPENEGWVGPSGVRLAVSALATNRVLVSDLHLSEVSGRAIMDYFVPLLSPAEGSQSGPAIGVFAVEINPNSFLFPDMQLWPTPSPTAETLLVRREGDAVLYLNELRHRTNTTLKLRFVLGDSPDLVAVKAALGKRGSVRGVDYRNQPVLAAIQDVPACSWIVITKRDTAEIYAPLRREAWMIGEMVTGLILAATLGVAFVWRNREYQFSLHEIAERKQAEEALRQSLERFQCFTAATFEGICVSEGGRILDANDQFLALYGCDRAEMTGREIVSLAAPNSRAMVAAAIDQDRTQAYEHQLLRKDGTLFVGEAQARTALWGNRKVRITALRDITDRKRDEQERERLMQELLRKNKELESIIYVSSHDLRSPLVNIQGFSHRLQSACEEFQRLLTGPDVPPHLQAAAAPILQKRMAPSLVFILTSVCKMDGLLSGFLRLSRLGRSALRVEVLDMKHLLESSVASCTFQIQQTGARVELGTLPRCRGDATQVSQVFSNLLDNALKYRTPGRAPFIQICGEERGTKSVYRIEDNGVGIAPENHEKIWDIFHRLNPSGPVKGEGLGLAIVRRILDRHGGGAWVESKPGSGSCFYVELPGPEQDTFSNPPEPLNNQ